MRSSLWAAPQGDELVVINAASREPELSYRLAGATIDSYLQWEIDNNVTQSQSAEQFFESLLVPYQQRLDDAREALAELRQRASRSRWTTPTALPTSRSRSRTSPRR